MSETTQEQSQNNQEVQQTQKTNDKEFNFSQMRKILEQEKAEKIEWQKRAETAEREKQEAQAKRSEEDDEGSSEPYIDEKVLNKKLAKFEERFSRTVDEKAEAKARSLMEAEKQNLFLRANPDFNDILREEIIQKFAEKHPEIAEPMLEMPNTFARQKLLYQNIKALGINKPPAQQSSIQDTIDKNRRSPYYQPTGVASTPYSSATGDFSETGQKAAFNKMQELKNRLRI